MAAESRWTFNWTTSRSNGWSTSSSGLTKTADPIRKLKVAWSPLIRTFARH